MIDDTEKSIIKGLEADGPDPVLKDKLMLFGQFVGDWEIESQWFLPNGLTPTGKGEIHFGWILNSTAIQDVWSGHVDNPPPGFPSTSFGTTIPSLMRFESSGLPPWAVSYKPLLHARLAMKLSSRG